MTESTSSEQQQVYFQQRSVSRMPGFVLSGRLSYRLRSFWLLYKATIVATWRQVFPRSGGVKWNWSFECSNFFLQEQVKVAFSLGNAPDAREFANSLTFGAAEHPDVEIRPGGHGEPKGDWYLPARTAPGRVMLYFHGGGYAFNMKSHALMIALIAEASGARTFALDYRLAPEHPHPAQLEDSMAAYRWLLASGVQPSQLVIAGDSAGGHLVLMTLLELKKQSLPQPALAVGFCPWTDTGKRGASLFGNDRYDWVQGEQTLTFSQWYRGDTGLSNLAVSPMYADLAGLAPVYLQAGDKEILHDMICDFAAEMRKQDAEVTLDVWKGMTHDFQAYGNMLPESRDALLKFGAMVNRCCGTKKQAEEHS